MREYCITRDQAIKGSRRKIQIVVGHRKRDIKAFREVIDPSSWVALSMKSLKSYSPHN